MQLRGHAETEEKEEVQEEQAKGPRFGFGDLRSVLPWDQNRSLYLRARDTTDEKKIAIRSKRVPNRCKI